MVTMTPNKSAIPTRSRRSRLGFTLIELLVTLAIIALLLSIAAPRYFGGIENAKETVLRQNLNQTRDAIDKFLADKGRYPDSIDDLVTSKYLRSIPLDPITDSKTTWVTVPPPPPQQGGLYDIKSGAPGNARDGSLYSSW